MALREGRQAELATNAGKALDQLANRRFSLILIDCQMPEVDGFTLTKQIREHEGGGAIPLMMLTSTGKPQHTVRCRELNLAFLSKPLDQSRLAEVVAVALGLRTSAEVANAPFLQESASKP